MVLASTPDSTTLDNLAELADKIMEVATPPSVSAATVAGTAHPQVWPQKWNTSVLMSSAWRSLSSSSLALAHPPTLPFARPLTLPFARLVALPRPLPPPPQTPQQIPSAGTTRSLVTRRRDVTLLAPGRQTSRPVTSGDRCHRPSPPKSPFLHT